MQDLKNKKFGLLKAIEVYGTANDGHKIWNCICDCGNTKQVQSSCLTKGFTKSCGCLRAKNLSKLRKQHGLSRTPEYRSWHSMIARCNGYGNERTKEAYFLRGIKVCESWTGHDGFLNFIRDVGPKPYSSYTLDRIDNNGDYEPSNVRWASPQQQAQNRRIKRIENFSDKEFLAEAARRGFKISSKKV